MAKFRLGATAIGFAVALTAAGNAFAIGSKADCEYEGGEVFTLPNEAQVCVIQVRAEAYHGEEYDGQQLGVKECEGDLIGDGLFCKITLKEGKKPVVAPAAEGEDAEGAATNAAEEAAEKAADGAEQISKEAAEEMAR